jgi:integrase
VKSRASARVLPLPETLAATLKAAKGCQAADWLASGSAYEANGYAVVDEAASR